MGGCSSKPKTAEFEVGMELQEDKSQNGAPGKSSESEKTGIDREQEPSEHSIQTLVTEREQEEGTHAAEDDRQQVKHILAGIISDSGVGKGLTAKEVLPEHAAVEVHEDPYFIMEVTKSVQETPLVGSTRAEAADAQQGSLTLLNKNLENKEKDTFPENKILSSKNIYISTVEDASKLEVGLQNGPLELSKHLMPGGEEISELERKPSSSEDVAMVLQEDECEELCNGTEARVCEVGNAANGAVLALERGEDVLRHSSKPVWEDEIEGPAFKEAAEELITGTTFVVKNSPPDQESSRDIDSTDAIHPAITADVSPNNIQHIMDQQDFGQEEQEVNVHVKPQANNHLVNGFLLKESDVETSNTPHGEGESISAKINMDEKQTLRVSEESSHVELLLKNSFGGVQEEKSYTVVICSEGQPKLDTSCTPDKVTASQAIATTQKPEAQPIHVIEFAELARIPAQDIPAPDIDEVLEKLASEFERQESLARATS